MINNNNNSCIKFLIISFLIITYNNSLAEEKIDENLIIEAETLENLLDRKLKASGNAILKKSGNTIQADFIEYDQISEELYARGNVKLDNGDSHIEGTELDYSIENMTGSIPNASFTTQLEEGSSKFNNSLRGTASIIFLEGENNKRAENVSITTCEIGQDDWFIKASEAEINQKSQRIIAKDAQLEFFDIPVFYSPYTNFSFNDERKSGFLVPSIGSTSRSGFEASTPYYFNLSPDTDATVTPRYYGKRGAQLAAEYRYLKNDYEGTSYIEYMPNDDEKSDRDDRYLMKINHSHNFGNGFTGFVKYEKVSDDDYFSDLSSLVSLTSQVSLPQEILLNYKSDKFNATLLTQKFDNLTSSSPYERLPSLQISHNKDFEDIYGNNYLETNLAFELTEFKRNSDFSGSSPEGTRVTSRPSIAIPFEASFGYIKPKISADIKHYNLDNNPAASNKDLFIPTFSIDSGLYFDRYFDLSGEKYSQTLEPRIFYSVTSYEDQSMLPMFDTALVDLNQNSIFSENQFVGGDRVMDSHQITFGATTRIINNEGLEKFSGTIAQRFYLDDRSVLTESQFSNSDYQSDTSDLFLSASTAITKYLKLKAEHQYNLDEEKTNRLAFSSRYNPDIGKIIDLSYRFINDPNSSSDIKQVNISGQWPLGSGWSSVARYQYDLEEHEEIESLAGLNYDAGCWTSSVLFNRIPLATTEKNNYTLFFMLELGGLGAVETGGSGALQEALNRNVPGAYLSRDLPDNYRAKYLK